MKKELPPSSPKVLNSRLALPPCPQSPLTHFLEPSVIASVPDYFAEFPNTHYALKLEIKNLWNLLRIVVRMWMKDKILSK